MDKLILNSVEVRSARKSFGSGEDGKNILNGLNMSVPPGSIYGLIGASGCGKTTLLSCILGMKTLDSGSITVLGQTVIHNKSTKLGHLIGYMPQITALISELTISETLSYFGNIFLMNKHTLEERSKMIMELLELPTDDRQVQHLSGGQQRRVSLAAAIIHNPLILILDEPTVGLDSLLRDKIWKFLIKSTRESNLSIIITTHYISEAQQSDRCGMMRDGVLLVEDSPLNILYRYDARSLDDAFLKLCYVKRRKSREREYLPVLRSNVIRDARPVCHHNSSAIVSFNNSLSEALSENRTVKAQIIGAISKKEFLRMRRQIAQYFLILILPIVNVLAFSYAVGGLPHGLKLGVVNFEENSPLACGQSFNSCDFSRTSCHLISEISSEGVVQVFFDTREDAFKAARHGEVNGVLSIHRNMSEIFRETVASGNIQNYADISLDQSNLQLTTFLQIRLHRAYENFNRKLLRNCETNEKLLSAPMNFNESFYGSIDSDFKVTMFPALLLQLIVFPALGFTALGIAQSRVDGVWDRTVLAGVRPCEILASQVILGVTVQLISFVEIIVTSYFSLSIVVSGSIWLLMLFGLAACLIGSFLGIALSIISEDIRAITYTVFLFTLLMTNLSGLQWPLEGQHWLLQVLSKSLPITIPSLSIRNIIVKGSGLADATVRSGLVINAVWMTISILAAYIGVKKKRFHNTSS